MNRGLAFNEKPGWGKKDVYYEKRGLGKTCIYIMHIREEEI